MDILDLKRKQLEQVAAYRHELQSRPHLTWLFFELTDRCDLACLHCGSCCRAEGTDLEAGLVEKVLTEVKNSGMRPMICLTGGEPLLHPRFFDIAAAVRRMGFDWGLTTNGYSLTRETAQALRAHGMATVSVSIDGSEASHDALRGRRGAWRRAVDAVRYLREAGFSPLVTSVFHRGNIGELESFYEFLCGIGVTYWRPINVEPIGRAAHREDLMLTGEELRRLLDLIREKRFDPSCPMEVTYGCSHFLGLERERMVRDHYFFCGAGLQVASIRCNGDICACLDIDDPTLAQGNVKTDSFAEVWRHAFRQFRRDRYADSEYCLSCEYRALCSGDSAHTWDFREKKPRLCARTFLTE